MSVGHIATLVLEGILGLFSAYAAYSLFTSTPPSIAQSRAALRYPRWYWVLAGCVSVVGATGLLVGLAIPTVGAVASVWMVAYFIVATLTHLARGDVKNLGMPLLFLAIFIGLVALRWADVGAVLAQLSAK